MDLVKLPPANFDALAYVVRSWTPRWQFAVFGATAFTIRGHAPPRRTDDVDITIAAAVEDLTELRRSLTPGGWESDSREPHRWRHDRLGLRLDVVPAGRNPGARSTIDMTPTFDIDVRGLDVALNTAETVNVGSTANDETILAPTPPLPVLVLLKIIAYDDKPTDREKDVFDVARVALGYLSDDDDRRWATPLSEINEVDYQSPVALAEDLKTVLRPEHQTIVERFFEGETVRRIFSTVFDRLHGSYVQDPGTHIAVAFLNELERKRDD